MAFAHVPTIVLVGSRDRLTPVRAARRIAEALPAAELTIFPEAGHMLPLERVSGVASRIAALAEAASAKPLFMPRGVVKVALLTPGPVCPAA